MLSCKHHQYQVQPKLVKSQIISSFFKNFPNNLSIFKYVSNIYAKQKHLGCKKVRGQSEATLQTGRRDQKV